MKKPRLFWESLAFVFACILPLNATEADLSTQLQIVEQNQPLVAASAVPKYGLFYSAKLANEGRVYAPIYPSNVGMNAWDLGNGAWLVDDLSTTVPVRNGLRTLDAGVPLPPGAGTNAPGGYTNTFTPIPINTNGLYLKIGAVTDGAVGMTLMNATDTVYAIWRATNLLSGWQMVMALYPSADTTNTLPFTVAAGGASLFWRAQDWTGVDANNDGIPDSWVYFWFGDLKETASDVDGVHDQTLGDDYTNGVEPNIISFWIQATNDHVNSMNAPVRLNISAGVPYDAAISVDDSNYVNDADWQPYTTSNLNVNLGLTEGWHDVWIGLKGYATNATVTWQEKRLKLDYTPPALVITNPAARVVAVPLLQLQGYSPEALSRLSYDVSNALGVVTNQPGQLLAGQFFDTNRWEYTTDYFQGYDLALATNANAITVRATDLAGNVTTTNFTVTLDYATATNPVIQLTWPPAGAEICGNRFTVRGWVDDATASVQAMITDTNGGTNVISGEVERNGKLWAENLPLNAGPNAVTLWVTNAAGLGSVTNFNVVKSDMILNLTNIDGDLWLPTVSVSGLISDPAAPVWVNGVAGTNYGNGTWSAANVPVPSGGVASFDVSTDPTNAPDPLTTVNTNKPTEIGVDSFHDTSVGNETGFWNYSASSGGTAHIVDDYYSHTQVVTTDLQYTPDFSVSLERVNYHFPDDPAGDYTVEATNGAPQTMYAEYEEGLLAGQGTARTSEEVTALRVGGKSEPDQKGLAALTAHVTGLVPTPDGEYYDDFDIPPEQISIPGFGEHLGTDGVAYAAVTLGSSVVVTPTTTVAPYYYFPNYHPIPNGPDSVQATIDTPKLYANQYDLSETNPEFCVGQQVNFEPEWNRGTPSITLASVFKWVLPAKYVNEPYAYSYSCTSYRQNPDLLTNESTRCWFVNGSGGAVHLAMNLQFSNGQQAVLTTKGKISVYRPKATITFVQEPRYYTISDNTGLTCKLKLGTNDATGLGAMFYKAAVNSKYDGNANITQLITTDYSNPLYIFSTERCDGSEFYNDVDARVYSNGTSGPIALDDGPSDIWTTPNIVNLSCRDFIRFKPDGAGIYVTLGIATWDTVGTAEQDFWGNWSITSDASTDPSNPDGSDEFPVWTQSITAH